jgi:hypothetical protein
MLEWIEISFAFFLGKALFGLIIGVLILLVIFLCGLPKIIKQCFCKHLCYRETRSCDAICNNCNKNLGFIGRIRDKKYG